MNWLPYLAMFIGGLVVGALLLFVMQSLWRRLNQSSNSPVESSQAEPQSLLIEELDDLRTRLRTAASWHVREERARLAVESELNAVQTAQAELVQAAKSEREQLEAALLAEAARNESLQAQLAEAENELTQTKLSSIQTAQDLEQMQQVAAKVADENSEYQIATLTTKLEDAQASAELQGERLAETQQQVDALQGRLDELLSLAGQFPIQATEIHRLSSRLKAVSEERDGLRAQLRKLAESFLEIRRRYQFVLHKLRTLLAKKQRVVEQQPLKIEAHIVESSEQPELIDERADDNSTLNGPAETVEEKGVELSELNNENGVDSSALNGQVEPLAQTDLKLSTVLPSLHSENGATADEPHINESISDGIAEGNAPADPDQLSQIRGIGPTYAMRLHQAGIWTFEQLIALPPEKIREIVKLRKWHKADPAEWIQQATSLL